MVALDVGARHGNVLLAWPEIVTDADNYRFDPVTRIEDEADDGPDFLAAGIVDWRAYGDLHCPWLRVRAQAYRQVLRDRRELLLGGRKVVGVDRRPGCLDMAKRVGQVPIAPDFF